MHRGMREQNERRDERTTRGADQARERAAPSRSRTDEPPTYAAPDSAVPRPTTRLSLAPVCFAPPAPIDQSLSRSQPTDRLLSCIVVPLTACGILVRVQSSRVSLRSSQTPAIFLFVEQGKNSEKKQQIANDDYYSATDDDLAAVSVLSDLVRVLDNLECNTFERTLTTSGKRRRTWPEKSMRPVSSSRACSGTPKCIAAIRTFAWSALRSRTL
jgi:hypothetical protein